MPPCRSAGVGNRGRRTCVTGGPSAIVSRRAGPGDLYDQHAAEVERFASIIFRGPGSPRPAKKGGVLFETATLLTNLAMSVAKPWAVKPLGRMPGGTRRTM